LRAGYSTVEQNRGEIEGYRMHPAFNSPEDDSMARYISFHVKRVKQRPGQVRGVKVGYSKWDNLNIE
jgi:hypothetical protein